MSTKMAPHMAFWFTYSFYGIQNKNTGNSKIIFMGSHKNRNIDRIGSNPSIEDLKPKANLSVFDNGQESIPFPADELPKLITAICRISSAEDLYEDSEMRAHLIAEDESPSNILYFERNFHEMKMSEVFNAALRKNQIYNYYYPEPLSRINDFQWLKFSNINFNRPIIKDEKQVGKITQLIAIGKDIKWNYPVIGFRKSWDNYTSIIPLVDTIKSDDGKLIEKFGLAIATTIQFLVYHKPPVRFITSEYYERNVIKLRRFFDDAPLMKLNFKDMPLDDLIWTLQNGV